MNDSVMTAYNEAAKKTAQTAINPDNFKPTITANTPKVKAPSKFAQGLKNIGSQVGGAIVNAGGEMLKAAAIGALSGLPSKDKVINSTDQQMGNIRNSINQTLMSGSAGPWGMVAGGVNMALEKLGANSDASKGLGKFNDTANAIASFIPGSGLFAKKTRYYAVNKTVQNSTGFTGTADSNSKASQNSDGRFIFGSAEADLMAKNAQAIDANVSGLIDSNKEILSAVDSTAKDLEQQKLFKHSGGWGMGPVEIGKNGMKVKNLSEIKRIARKANKLNSNIKKLSLGGTYGYIENEEKNDIVKEHNIIKEHNNIEKNDDLNNIITKHLNIDIDNMPIDKILDELKEYSLKINPPFIKDILDNDDIDLIYGNIIDEDVKNEEDKCILCSLRQYINDKCYEFSKDEKEYALKIAKKNNDCLIVKNIEAELFITNYKKMFNNQNNDKHNNENNNCEKFKNGGIIDGKSIIPEGALHSRKHELAEIDPELAEQVTAKGVPVVTFEKRGEIEQHAEIERGEIIFRKEITEKLEKLWKEGTEKAAIEAGRMIADEIMNNTIDNSEEYEIEN